ncbi:hypothetical protein DESC_350054 [Desulfosarcina cetonica]|nr:hypothetical protein DESC_350054 [Desulfosarcina cetonica]
MHPIGSALFLQARSDQEQRPVDLVQDAHGHAAVKGSIRAALAMAGHGHQIHGLPPGHRDDAADDIPAFDDHPGDDIDAAPFVGNGLQVGLGFLVSFVARFEHGIDVHHLILFQQQIGGIVHAEQDHRGAEMQGQMLHMGQNGLRAQRSIQGNQNLLVHGLSPCFQVPSGQASCRAGT